MNLPFVSFRYTYTFLADGAVITSDSTLRFRSRDELESSLAAQGYQVLQVREAPDRPGHEFVFITSAPPDLSQPVGNTVHESHPQSAQNTRIFSGHRRGRRFLSAMQNESSLLLLSSACPVFR